jgi:Rrf2 family protein
VAEYILITRVDERERGTIENSALKTLSKKCKYALEALYCLSQEYGKGPILIGTLAERHAIPHKFLEVILLELRHRGLVDSKKGRKGGYFLALPPESVTIGSIVRIIDGPLAPLPCASETAYRKCEECVEERLCGTRMVMKDVRNAIAAILDHTTLADVCSRIEAAGESAGHDHELMYYI